MGNGSGQTVLGWLSHVGRDEAGDAELLERFTARCDEQAFAVLLRRHGPMVYGLCRRVLRQEQDAEDAFQATFLVLTRKAASVRDGQALAAWLARVAVRVACQSRRSRTEEGPLPEGLVAPAP